MSKGKRCHICHHGKIKNMELTSFERVVMADGTESLKPKVTTVRACTMCGARA